METDGSFHRLTLATQITITRILLVPVFLLVAGYYIDGVWDGHPQEILRWVALGVFMVAGSTDALDGYVARLRHERSKLGTLLDPIADKALLLSGVLVLTGPWGRNFVPHIPVWYVVLVISRDVLMAIGGVVIHVTAGHVEIQPRIVGKIATVFQLVLICWVLASLASAPFFWLLGAAAAFTLLSAVLYILDGIHQLEKAHAHEVKP